METIDHTLDKLTKDKDKNGSESKDSDENKQATQALLRTMNAKRLALIQALKAVGSQDKNHPSLIAIMEGYVREYIDLTPAMQRLYVMLLLETAKNCGLELGETINFDNIQAVKAAILKEKKPFNHQNGIAEAARLSPLTPSVKDSLELDDEKERQESYQIIFLDPLDEFRSRLVNNKLYGMRVSISFPGMETRRDSPDTPSFIVPFEWDNSRFRKLDGDKRFLLNSKNLNNPDFNFWIEEKPLEGMSHKLMLTRWLTEPKNEKTTKKSLHIPHFQFDNRRTYQIIAPKSMIVEVDIFDMNYNIIDKMDPDGPQKIFSIPTTSLIDKVDSKPVKDANQFSAYKEWPPKPECPAWLESCFSPAEKEYKRKALNLGVPPKDLRHGWFSEHHLSAIERVENLPYSAIREKDAKEFVLVRVGITEEMVKAMKHGMSETHLKYLNDVYNKNGNLTETKQVFDEIKDCTQEEMRQRMMLESQVMALNMGFDLEEDILKPWFSNEHVEAADHGRFAAEELRGLNAEQVREYVATGRRALPLKTLFLASTVMPPFELPQSLDSHSMEDVMALSQQCASGKYAQGRLLELIQKTITPIKQGRAQRRQEPPQASSGIRRAMFTDLQYDYLTSPLVKKRIVEGQETVHGAFEATSDKGLNWLSYGTLLSSEKKNKEEAIKLGIPPKDLRHGWFTEHHLLALKQGFPYESIRQKSVKELVLVLVGITAERISTMKHGLTPAHLDYFYTLYVDSKTFGLPGALSDDHISASLQSAFERIKNLTHLEVLNLKEDEWLKMKAEWTDLARSNQSGDNAWTYKGFHYFDLTAPWFSQAHVEATRHGKFTAIELRGRTEEQVRYYVQYGRFPTSPLAEERTASPSSLNPESSPPALRFSPQPRTSSLPSAVEELGVVRRRPGRGQNPAPPSDDTFFV